MGELGSVFVVRNVANMVVSTDMNLMAALQYAVNDSKYLSIIVCGHMTAVACEYGEEGCVPPLEWRNIRDICKFIMAGSLFYCLYLCTYTACLFSSRLHDLYRHIFPPLVVMFSPQIPSSSIGERH
jgi:hypothetical protein